MGRILSVLAATSVVLAALAGVTFGLGDANTVVPPPESVAEGLLRQLAARRYQQTQQYLSRSARLEYTADRLRDWTSRLEAGVGGLVTVQAQDAEINNATARATVHVQGKSGDRELQIQLQRENGLWAIEALPPPG